MQVPACRDTHVSRACRALCVLTCGALPARPGGEGLVSGDSGPETQWRCCQTSWPRVATEKELFRARLFCHRTDVLCPEPHAGVEAISPGQLAGPAEATSGCGDIVCVCVGVRGTHHLCSHNPGSTSSPRSGAGPQMATWLSVAFPVERGGGPSPPWRPGCWQVYQAVPGMEFPAFLVRRMASESYLLCLWHQLVSWSRGGVRETRARGPEGSFWAASFLLGRLAISHPLLYGHDRI